MLIFDKDFKGQRKKVVGNQHASLITVDSKKDNFN